MADLKPCPFCGDEADVLEYQHQGFPKTYGVECLGCGGMTFQFFMTEDEAIAAWNRRAEEGDENG